MMTGFNLMIDLFLFIMAILYTASKEFVINAL